MLQNEALLEGLRVGCRGERPVTFFFSNVLCTKHQRKARIQGFHTKVTSALNCVVAMGPFMYLTKH